MADISQNPQSNIKPDESNIYIRTMNQDMQNLNQGGGNFSPGLGAQQQPIPNPSQMPSQTPSQTPTSFDQSSLNELKQKIQNINSGASLNQTQNIPINPTSPAVPPMVSEPPVPPASAPSLAGGLSQNTPLNYQTFYSAPQTPMATPIEPLSSFPPNSPASSQPSQPNDNIMFNPSLSPELSNVPSNIPMQDSQSMGQFNVATEPSLEASSIPTYTKPKTNTKKLLIPIIIIIVLLGFYFLIWPKLFKPKNLTSNIPGITSPVVSSPLQPTTSSTTLPALNFSKTKGDVINYKLDIDITGAPIILSTIKKEAEVLGTPNQIKIIEPTVKGQKLSSKEVLHTLIKNVPQVLSDAVKTDYLVYTYYGEINPALGLIFDIDPSKLQDLTESMLLWEKNKALIKDSINLWLFSPKTPTAKTFKEQEILGVKVRYFAYPEKEAALVYAITDHYWIITTSLESMTSAIDHLSVGMASNTTTSTTKLVIPEVPVLPTTKP